MDQLWDRVPDAWNNIDIIGRKSSSSRIGNNCLQAKACQKGNMEVFQGMKENVSLASAHGSG